MNNNFKLKPYEDSKLEVSRDDLVFIKNIMKLSNTDDVNFSLLDNVFNAMEHDTIYRSDIIDSFSYNQMQSKSLIVKHLNDLNLLNKDTEVVIWGCWYGSIIIPLLHDKVKKITAIDTDSQAITTGENRILAGYDNVEWITANIFDDYRDMYDTADIFINTSCEHMRPMKWWGPKGPRGDHNWFKEWNGKYQHNDKLWPVYKEAWWDRVKPTAHFAFTSNDMDAIEGHTNCVHSIEEFKLQLPPRSEVLIDDALVDDRGTRYILIGKV